MKNKIKKNRNCGREKEAFEVEIGNFRFSSKTSCDEHEKC